MLIALNEDSYLSTFYQGDIFTVCLIPLIFFISFLSAKLISIVYYAITKDKGTSKLTTKVFTKTVSLTERIRNHLVNEQFSDLENLYQNEILLCENFFDDSIIFETIVQEFLSCITRLNHNCTRVKDYITNLNIYINKMNDRHSYISLATYEAIIEIFLHVDNLSKSLSILYEMRKRIKPEISTYTLFTTFFNNHLKNSCYNISWSQTKFDEFYNYYKLDIGWKQCQDPIKILFIYYFNHYHQYFKVSKTFEKWYKGGNFNLSIDIYNYAMTSYIKQDKHISAIAWFQTLNSNQFTSLKWNLTSHLIMLKAYCEWKYHVEAKNLVNHLTYIYAKQINIQILNTIAEIFYDANDFYKCISILKDAESKYGIKLDINSYYLLMKVYSILSNEDRLIDIYDEVIEHDSISPDLRIYTLWLNYFVKEKKIDQAIGIFVDMKINKCSIGSMIYESIISACFVNGKNEKAIEFLLSAEREKIALSPLNIKNGCEAYLKENYSKIDSGVKQTICNVIYKFGIE